MICPGAFGFFGNSSTNIQHVAVTIPQTAVIDKSATLDRFK